MRLFSLDEANEIVALIRPIVAQLVEQRRAIREQEKRLTEIRGAVLGNGSHVDPREEATLRAEVSAAAEVTGELLARIVAVGAQVKDVDIGLLDFPARHPSGDTVLLCWRLGEDEIAFWHGLDDGYPGRKPLPF